MIARNLVKSLSAPRYAVELSGQLIKQGHEVYILTSNVQAEVRDAKLVKVCRPFAKRLMAPMAYSLIAKYVKRKHSIDIVHGHGYTILDDILTVHFLRKTYARQLRKFGYAERAIEVEKTCGFEGAILNSSRHLIAVSSLVKKSLVGLYGISKEKVSIVHNGVNIEEFALTTEQEKANLRLRYGLAEDKIYVAFVGGSSHERKGLESLLRTMPHIPKDVHLLVVGGGYGKYRELASRLNVVNRVTFIPYVLSIQQVYTIADIFVLPTFYDPFPLAALEAMATGLAVVISPYAGTKDILRNGVNGILLNGLSDIAELAESITVLAHSDKLRRTLGVNARLTAERFSWENVAKKTLEVYEKTLRR